MITLMHKKSDQVYKTASYSLVTPAKIFADIIAIFKTEGEGNLSKVESLPSFEYG